MDASSSGGNAAGALMARTGVCVVEIEPMAMRQLSGGGQRQMIDDGIEREFRLSRSAGGWHVQNSRTVL